MALEFRKVAWICILKFCEVSVIQVFTKASLKIGTVRDICWNSLGLLREITAKIIYLLGIFFFKIESWNFQHHLTLFSSFKYFLFPFFLSIFWLSWNFVRFHETFFSKRCWNFQLSILKNKKSFISKKLQFI